MILKDIWLDVKAVQARDPAARSALEVLLLYQGVHALILHRFAHWFYRKRLFFIARLISQISRFFTLIEIHPGAQLGHGILIDHGCGVVIGETAVVGDNCTIYQGVTLGGVGLNKGKRHPTLGNNVTVGCGAKILGAFEVGDNCSIAANAVLLKPLEDNVTAVGIPARPVKKDGVRLPPQKTVHSEEIERLNERIAVLERQLEESLEEIASGGAYLYQNSGQQGHRQETFPAQAETEAPPPAPEALPEDVEAVVKNWHQVTNRLHPLLRTYLKGARLKALGGGKLGIIAATPTGEAFLKEEAHLREIRNVILQDTGKEMEILVACAQTDPHKDVGAIDIEQVIHTEIEYEDE